MTGRRGTFVFMRSLYVRVRDLSANIIAGGICCPWFIFNCPRAHRAAATPGVSWSRRASCHSGYDREAWPARLGFAFFGPARRPLPLSRWSHLWRAWRRASRLLSSAGPCRLHLNIVMSGRSQFRNLVKAWGLFASEWTSKLIQEIYSHKSFPTANGKWCVGASQRRQSECLS